MFFSSWNSLLLLFPSWSSTATNSFDPMNSRFSHTAEPGCKQNTVLHQQHQLSISIRFSRLEMLYNLLYNIMNIMRLPFFQDFSDCFHHMVEPLNERLLKLCSNWLWKRGGLWWGRFVIWCLVLLHSMLVYTNTGSCLWPWKRDALWGRLHSMQVYTHCLSKRWFMFMAVKEGCSLVKVCHLMIRCYSTPCRAIHTVLANTGSCLWQLTRHFQTVTCHVIHPHQLPPPRHLPLVLIIISYCNSMALIMNMHHCH